MVVSGIVAVTLSPVMSSRFVQEHGHETKLTRLVNRGFEAVRRTYARLLEGAIGMRWAVVAGAALVMAAWPLYSYRGASWHRSRIRATSASSCRRRRIRRSPPRIAPRWRW